MMTDCGLGIKVN